MKLPKDRLEDLRDLFIAVALEQGAAADEDAMSQDAEDDDTGVDKVGYPGDKMNLEDIRPDDADKRRGYDDFENQIKPWTPSEIDTIKESVTEAGIGGELPGFPGLPPQ